MGNENRLFYYPYASFNSDQIPLLKVAALYFDQLVLLDPEAASWARIGADPAAQAAVRLLAGEGLLESVSPAETLAAYQGQILDAVREDMSDQQFLSLCETRQGIDARGRWTLALAKVPQALRQDQVMREVLGDAAREIARQTGYTARDYVEHIEALSYLPGNTQQVPQVVVQRAHTYDDYSSTGIVFDEGNRADHPGANYRYVDLPLALGESIMVNHAIFTGLVQQ